MNKVMNRRVQMFITPKEEENIRPRRGRTLYRFLQVINIQSLRDWKPKFKII